VDKHLVEKFLKLKGHLLILILALVVMVGLKVWLLIQGVVPFNSDEAIVGLMARHILAGEPTTFFYGQAYMGSLDAILVGVLFNFLGHEVWVVRLLQIILYAATIITTVLVAKAAFGSIETGIIAAILLAVPNINTTLYTTISLGGYGEALLLGNLLILLGLFIVRNTGWFLNGDENHSSDFKKIFSERGWMLTCLLGAVVGFGLWVNGLTLVYSIPVVILVLYVFLRNFNKIGRILLFQHVSFGLLGFFLGAAPWWVYAIQHGAEQLIFELFGSAVSVESGSIFNRFISHMFNLTVLGGTVILGIRPPWEIRWLAVPLLPFNLIFWFGVFFFWVGQIRKGRAAYLLFAGIAITLALGFLLTSFGVDPSGRYFLPLAVPMALVGAELVRSTAEQIQKNRLLFKIVPVGLVIFYNLWGTIECANRYPPGINSQFDLSTVFDRRYDDALLRFLEENNLKYGYTNYWVAYPITFLSQEELIYVPRLPYHDDLRYTSRDDRYPPYTELVRSAESITYITTRSPNLDRYIERAFKAENIQWQENWIGDYHIFYNLSRIIHPEEIGLGITTP